MIHHCEMLTGSDFPAASAAAVPSCFAALTGTMDVRLRPCLVMMAEAALLVASLSRGWSGVEEHLQALLKLPHCAFVLLQLLRVVAHEHLLVVLLVFDLCPCQLGQFQAQLLSCPI